MKSEVLLCTPLKRTLFSNSWCPRSELGHVSRPRCGFACHSFRVPPAKQCFACGLDLNRRKKSSLKRTLFSNRWCPRSEPGHVSRPRCGFACHSFRAPPAKQCFACGLNLDEKKARLSELYFLIVGAHGGTRTPTPCGTWT